LFNAVAVFFRSPQVIQKPPHIWIESPVAGQLPDRSLAHIRILIGGGALLELWQGVWIVFPAAGQLLDRSLAHIRILIGGNSRRDIEALKKRAGEMY
jgi:hypothetical protein